MSAEPITEPEPEVFETANKDDELEADPSRTDTLPPDEDEPISETSAIGGGSFVAILAQDEQERKARRLELVRRGIDPDAYPPAEWPKLLQGSTTSGELAATPLTEIAMRSITWLERPLWQASAFQLLGGAKGAGKGTYLAGLAARISRAGQNVLFVSTEDSTEIDLKPRLVAAGAEIGRCYVIRQHVQLPGNIDQLRALAIDVGGVGLFIVDPIANHIGNRDSNGDVEVRDAIAPLNGLADELGCLLIGVRHPGKDRSRGALASILGSTAWVDTPRAVVYIAVDDEDPLVRHIQVVAGNRSLNGSAQAFRIDAVDVPGLTEPITLAVALGESAKDVNDLLASSARDESKTDRARELILDVLEDCGEQESDALDARVARETGLAAQTIRNARVKLGKEGLVKARPEKDEFGSVMRWLVTRTGAPRP